MITKTTKAIDLYKAGDFKGSLKLFSKFRIGLIDSEKECLKIAHECVTGSASFYEQIGIDTESVIVDSKEIIENYVNQYDLKKHERRNRKL